MFRMKTYNNCEIATLNEGSTVTRPPPVLKLSIFFILSLDLPSIFQITCKKSFSRALNTNLRYLLWSSSSFHNALRTFKKLASTIWAKRSHFPNFRIRLTVNLMSFLSFFQRFRVKLAQLLPKSCFDLF